MANYYYVNIESEKMTQDVANEIFQTIVPKQRIRWFKFSEGHLYYNSRGLVDIAPILNAYGFNDKEDKIEVEDEFEYAYENMLTPEEVIQKNLETALNSIQRFKEHGVELTKEMIDIREKLNSIIKKG